MHPAGVWENPGGLPGRNLKILMACGLAGAPSYQNESLTSAVRPSGVRIDGFRDVESSMAQRSISNSRIHATACDS